MSIGFIGSGTIQRTSDIFTGGGSKNVSLSLQNVLTKYDRIKTDLDRLVDQSQRGTYDITSRQHYNSYNKESVNGWSETWYSEYRAILALRADALQKKLQAAYNRVLDKSIYAEMKADQDSIFAPYANRTKNDLSANTLNNKMRISNILVADQAITTTNPTDPTTPYTPIWGLTGVYGEIMDYLNADTDPLTPYTSPSVPGPSSTGIYGANNNSYYQYHNYSNAGLTPPYPPVPPPGGTMDPGPRNAQRTAVASRIVSEITAAGLTPGTKEYDDAVENGLYIADELWKSLIDIPGGKDNRNIMSASDFADTVGKTLSSIINPPPPGTVGGTGPGSGSYAPETPLGNNGPDNHVGNVDGGYRIKTPMFGMGDLVDLVPEDIREILKTVDTSVVGDVNNIINNFIGEQFNNIYKGNQYESKVNTTSLTIIPLVGAGGKSTILDTLDDTIPLPGSVLYAGGSGLTLFNSSTTISAGPVQIELGASAGVDLYYGHGSAISNLSGSDEHPPVVDLPQIGLGSFSVGISIAGVPIATMIVSQSYDIFTDIFTQILQKLKKLMVEALEVNSYSTSSGTAMDSYASRAEYHFTSPGFLEAMKTLNITAKLGPLNIPLPFGDIIGSALFSDITGLFSIPGFVGTLDGSDMNNVQINGVKARERIFTEKNNVQGAESRETETGAFFATNAFLSQFELDSMESEYWIGTQQNEEMVNMDLSRVMTAIGPELLKTLYSTLSSAMPDKGGAGAAAGAALFNALLSSFNNAAMTQMMYDLMYVDQKGTSGETNASAEEGPSVLGIKYPRIMLNRSSFKSEAYDYIENDHKPFESDSDFNYPKPNILSGIPVVGDLFSSMEDFFRTNTPDFILEGNASTRRFTETPDDMNINLTTLSKYGQDAAIGLGPRGHAGRTGVDDPAHDMGFWADTWLNGSGQEINDINEVYSATRKVKFSDLTMGFGEFTTGDFTQLIGQGGVTTAVNTAVLATRETEANVKRFIGVDSRAIERRYDTADTVNHESFATNLYTADTYGRKFYDRRNEYNISFATKADSNSSFKLFGSQALNPTMGGFLKMGVIDKNKSDEVYIRHENAGMGGVRALGTATLSDADVQKLGSAPDESLNDFNATLYEHLHLRSDGSNLGLIREYRDVFESGLVKSMFISGQSYHPSGGGISSSIEIRYDSSKGRSNLQGYDNSGSDIASRKKTREDYDATDIKFDPYNTPYLTRSRGQTTMYLNSYFATKKRSSNNK